ncbi:uncharacterized protein YALI1_E28259g [Yarrowia lipolytica]|uniref:Uncharacterized protein n=1 Tax=Yarrowia lipolytica TaxID=4952 RepID=A0A1D8NJR6_YARLL|nr:hypothetical protein YALI1_E28259g [Yarrowia lipolytica]
MLDPVCPRTDFSDINGQGAGRAGSLPEAISGQSSFDSSGEHRQVANPKCLKPRNHLFKPRIQAPNHAILKPNLRQVSTNSPPTLRQLSANSPPTSLGIPTRANFGKIGLKLVVYLRL